MRRRDQRGGVAVEFALLLPVFAMVIFGIIQYGYYFFATQSASSAARDAARVSAVGNCADDTALTTYVGDKLGALDYSELSVVRTYSPLRDVGNTVSVNVSFQTLNLHFPFIPVPNGGEVTRTFDTRVEDLDSGTCA